MNKIITFFIFTLMTSCAFLNEDYVSVPFSSNPPGASLYIDQNYAGKTPTKVNIIPNKKKIATFVYGNQKKNVPMEIFSSLRENRDNSADTIRCLLDSLGIIFIIPAASITSIKCKDFNKKEYSVNFSNNYPYENYPY